ncbi:MAG: RNA 2',3'-cyclic phosphodiesterase [Sideroxydans sp.]|nr:RNA 2',3'-cyclic phosphodiesterase [Sideroxydans sp.]
MTNRQEDKSARVFFALWPGKAQQTALAAWQPPLKKLCGGKAMRAETLHTTLVFLGNVAQHRLEALKLAAQEVSGAPFELCLDEVRYWGHNHIAYAAPAGVPAQLARLVQQLEQRLHQHRFRFDPRSYKPHLTLLRHAKWDDTPLPAPPAVAWPVHEFVLAQSLRDERGAYYRMLAYFPLVDVKANGLP